LIAQAAGQQMRQKRSREATNECIYGKEGLSPQPTDVSQDRRSVWLNGGFHKRAQTKKYTDELRVIDLERQRMRVRQEAEEYNVRMERRRIETQMIAERRLIANSESDARILSMMANQRQTTLWQNGTVSVVKEASIFT
jgi:hypothetical protein